MEKCHYTWLGLKELISSSVDSRFPVYYAETITQCIGLIAVNRVDTLILGASDEFADAAHYCDFLREIKMKYPVAKIIVIAEFNYFFLHKLQRLGLINAILHKRVGLDELLVDMDKALLLDFYICGYIRKLSERLNAGGEEDSLTFAEKNILGNLLLGKNLGEISRLLDRSVKTISAQKRNGMRKLGLKNDCDLVSVRHRLRYFG